ncbi:MAG: GNAT family N-acetyltransferase [archaeon]
MEIKKATISDAPVLQGIIKREFSYTKFSPQTIVEKLVDERFLIIKTVDKKEFVGFAELDLLNDPAKLGQARLNAVYVSDKFRKKGVATKLVKKLLSLAKKKKLKKVFLLVRFDNELAKGLYLKCGFLFEKIHDKIIEGKEVEVWSTSLK